jgi:LysM repeat protein
MRRSSIGFLLLNFVISAAAVFLVLNFAPQSGGSVTERQVTYVVFQTQPAQIVTQVVIVTPTPGPGEGNIVELPPELLQEGGAQGTTPLPEFTLDAALAQANPELAQTASSLPAGCIPHALADGENPSIVADIYGADVFELLAVNNLTEETSGLLQIGQILIVPLEGCALVPETQVVEVTEGVSVASVDGGGEVTPQAEGTTEANLTAAPALRPTLTLAPTAANAQVVITDIISAGDITAEAVVILNNGAVVNLGGWTLSDGEGNTFVFPEGRRLFQNGRVTVNTRSGENTPVALFWGRDREVFEPGDVIVLADADGVVQATRRIPSVP